MHGGLELFSQKMSDLCPLSPFFSVAVFKGSVSFQPIFNETKIFCPACYESHALPVKLSLHLVYPYLKVKLEDLFDGYTTSYIFL